MASKWKSVSFVSLPVAPYWKLVVIPENFGFITWLLERLHQNIFADLQEIKRCYLSATACSRVPDFLCSSIFMQKIHIKISIGLSSVKFDTAEKTWIFQHHEQADELTRVRLQSHLRWKMEINDKLALGEWNRGRWKKKKKFAKAKQSSPKLSLPLSLLNERYYQYAVNFTNKFELWKTFWLFFFFKLVSLSAPFDSIILFGSDTFSTNRSTIFEEEWKDRLFFLK